MVGTVKLATSGANRSGGGRHHHRLLVLGLITVVLLAEIERARAHGRLEEPAARNCAWRFGYKTPENYNDNELNCGGVGQQWTTNGCPPNFNIIFEYLFSVFFNLYFCF